MKVAAYIRVSTETQTTDNQLPSIKELCKNRSWELVKIYSENASAWSGGRQAELDRCIRDAEHNHFEIIVVWSLDRVSREGLLRVLSLIEHLHQRGIKLLSVQESWSETAGDFAPVLYAITAWVGKWQSDRKSEATKAGIVRANLSGKGKRGTDKKKRVRRWLKRPRINTLDFQS